MTFPDPSDTPTPSAAADAASAATPISAPPSADSADAPSEAAAPKSRPGESEEDQREIITDAVGKSIEAAPSKAKSDKSKEKGAKQRPRKFKEPLPALSPLVEEACAWVEQFFEHKLSPKLVFHNLEHTVQVVKAARRLANDQHLTPADTELLLLAAYFHDTGYTQRYVGHEAVSADLAADFLKAHNYPAAGIEQVRHLIMATEVGSETRGALADTLVDADRSGMGREDFAAAGERLRLEWEMYLPDRSFSTPDWLQYQFDYLNETDFRTEAARRRFGPGREDNIAVQEKAIDKVRKKEKKKERDSRETLAQPKRGIETMFHNIYSTHQNLSGMADQKANMMIQLNTLLLSGLITYLAARTTTQGIAVLQNPIVIVPGALLLATALGSVVTAILSAQPEITSFRLNTKVKPTANRRVNLLFFGNFVKLPLEEFQEGMRDLMRQKDALYMNMATDIYYLGDVLSKKYRLLKISYTVFMVGIILVVFSFVISVLYKGHL